MKKHTRERGLKQRVLRAIDNGGCNTSRDVADETGISIERATGCVHRLKDDGILRMTDRVIVLGHRRRHRVFEVVA